MELLHHTTWHDHDIDFARWLQPAMWQVALGWHAMNFAQTSTILEFYIWFWVHRSRHAPVCEILSKSDHPQQKKMTSCRFSKWRISAILDFMGLVMGSLNSPCTTSYGSSIETIALNYLVFFRKSRFCNLATDRQTDKQTNRRTDGQARCRSRCRERRLNNTIQIRCSHSSFSTLFT